MKKMLTLLLVLALLLSTATSAYAADITEDNEQTRVSESQIVTVGTLEELETAIAAAADGDTIAISAKIMLDGVVLETKKDITLVRSDTYKSGVLFRMENDATLSGFNIEDANYSRTIICESSSEIKMCSFSGDSAATFIFIGSSFADATVSISDCNFIGAKNSAIRILRNSQVTILNSTFCDNSSDTQGGAIYCGDTLILKNCTFSGNKAASGGGVYCSGDLTITECQFNGNSIESEKFGTDILSFGTLNITDTPQEGVGYYEESTGEKLSLPLDDFEDTAKLIYLTDEDVKAYFAPAQEEPAPDDEPSIDRSNDDETGDTPNDPTVIYVPVYIRVPAEPETAESAPVFVCGDAVIDVSRSVKLEGYDDGLLHLEEGLTRAQFAKILCSLLDEDTLERYRATNTAFTDISPKAWYCSYVNTIANAGIVCGTGDGFFDPDGVLTWGHIITVLSRFAEPQKYDLRNIQYDGWAKESIETAVALGWLNDHAVFNPDAAISRGELVYFLNYVLGLYR